MAYIPKRVAVANAQRALRAVKPRLAVDGRWGPVTDSAYDQAPVDIQLKADAQLLTGGLTVAAIRAFLNEGQESKLRYRQEVEPAILQRATEMGLNGRVIAAQLRLESGNGARTSGRYNYAGIKARGGQPSTMVKTREADASGNLYATVQPFRDFDTPQDFVEAYLRLITSGRYASAYRLRDVDAAAEAIHRAGYATDPAYATKLASLARDVRVA